MKPYNNLKLKTIIIGAPSAPQKLVGHQRPLNSNYLQVQWLSPELMCKLTHNLHKQ